MSRVFYLPHFLKQIDRIEGNEAERLGRALIKFRHFIQLGEKTEGLGFKKLGSGFYEIRVGIHKRIVMQEIKGDFYLALYGGHDEVEQFLKRQ